MLRPLRRVERLRLLEQLGTHRLEKFAAQLHLSAKCPAGLSLAASLVLIMDDLETGYEECGTPRSRNDCSSGAEDAPCGADLQYMDLIAAGPTGARAMLQQLPTPELDELATAVGFSTSGKKRALRRRLFGDVVRYALDLESEDWEIGLEDAGIAEEADDDELWLRLGGGAAASSAAAPANGRRG